MAFPPRLLLIGAQKAGTTTLASLLARHPDIALGKEKEPDFYARNWHRGPDWYRANYPEPDIPWLIDASTSYTAGFHDPDTGAPMPIADRIAQTVSDPRFLFVLRDPVDRAWSAYWHDVRYGGETRRPEEVLTPDSLYIRQSCYADRLTDFIDHFSIHQILILHFEEVTGNQQKVMDRVTTFLDIPPLTLEEQPARKNTGYQFSPVASGMRRLFPNDRAFSSFLDFIKSATPAFLRPWLKKLGTRKIPPIPAALKADLAEIFEPHTRRLEEMMDMSLPHWRRPPC